MVSLIVAIALTGVSVARGHFRALRKGPTMLFDLLMKLAAISELASMLIPTAWIRILTMTALAFLLLGCPCPPYCSSTPSPSKIAVTPICTVQVEAGNRNLTDSNGRIFVADRNDPTIPGFFPFRPPAGPVGFPVGFTNQPTYLGHWCQAEIFSIADCIFAEVVDGVGVINGSFAIAANSGKCAGRPRFCHCGKDRINLSPVRSSGP